MTISLAPTIAPKSDQLNADDLIAGPITITVKKVAILGEPDQPVAVHYEGDNGKPYKPCKSMRRVMVHVWGDDGSKYAGRQMTLYRDDRVTFGKDAVGGIRISHMSHIDRDVVMALTVTRAQRKPYTVKPLRGEPVQQVDLLAVLTAGRAAALKGTPALEAWWNGLSGPEKHAAKDKTASELKPIAKAADEGRAQPPADDDTFPGDLPPPSDDDFPGDRP